MTNQEDQDTRYEFYNKASVKKHIAANGVPRSLHAFRDMVASGTTKELDSEERSGLVTCLGNVVFSKHPQQINVMDRSNGKTIASIKR